MAVQITYIVINIYMHNNKSIRVQLYNTDVRHHCKNKENIIVYVYPNVNWKGFKNLTLISNSHFGMVLLQF